MVSDAKRNKQTHLVMTLTQDKIEWPGGYCAPIDGSYPNYAQVFPTITADDSHKFTLRSDVLGKVSKALGGTAKTEIAMTLTQSEQIKNAGHGPVVITSNSVKGICGPLKFDAVIMTMRQR
jgi:hypothetical protein